MDPRKQQPGRPRSGRVTCTHEDYHALIKDCFPAYISWEQYERNLARLWANRAQAEVIGAVRHGPSLLAGLLICGRCGSRMFVRYGGPRQRHSYTCSRRATDYGDDYCQYLPGPPLDDFVSQWVLRTLEPAALELSLAAAAHLEHERAELDRLWQQRLERAAFEADRTARHYRLCEPEHRLVARQLAKDWEAKLATQQQLQEDYERFCHQQPRLLSAAERDAIRRLAQDLPALWHDSTTTMAERKDLIRQLIQQIHVENEGASERLQVTIDWVGGGQTTGVVIRPISQLEHLSTYPQLCERIRCLTNQGLNAIEIADCLTQEGYHPPKQAKQFRPEAIRALMYRLGLRQPCTRKRAPLGPDEWWLADLACTLELSGSTLYRWIQRGEVNAHQHEANQRWIVWADPTEVERLKQRGALPPSHSSRKRWLDTAPATMARLSS